MMMLRECIHPSVTTHGYNLYSPDESDGWVPTSWAQLAFGHVCPAIRLYGAACNSCFVNLQVHWPPPPGPAPEHRFGSSAAIGLDWVEMDGIGLDGMIIDMDGWMGLDGLYGLDWIGLD